VENADDPHLGDVLDMGCWTPRETVSATRAAATWGVAGQSADGSCFDVLLEGAGAGRVEWDQLGEHNMHNALAAIAAARHAGVPVGQAVAALAEYRGVKRRMEVRGERGGVTVYDDFAHHPTAIASTLQGLRNRVGGSRILLVLEPRSNTMRLGVHRDTLATSMQGANRVWLHQPEDIDWSLAEIATQLDVPVSVEETVEAIVGAVAAEARAGDHILIMSNGGFGGIHDKLLAALEDKSSRLTG
jgi:UDP-N-acetylmuramate: L-alanyl-gamma-D-glutamyl-meso-diaminopimelate ligase